jgi:hypothetical protein
MGTHMTSSTMRVALPTVALAWLANSIASAETVNVRHPRPGLARHLRLPRLYLPSSFVNRICYDDGPGVPHRPTSKTATTTTAGWTRVRLRRGCMRRRSVASTTRRCAAGRSIAGSWVRRSDLRCLHYCGSYGTAALNVRCADIGVMHRKFSKGCFRATVTQAQYVFPTQWARYRPQRAMCRCAQTSRCPAPQVAFGSASVFYRWQTPRHAHCNPGTLY